MRNEKMIGIVALVATMMLGANCGGPDGNDTDGGACTNCTTPDGGCTTNCGGTFTATIKAVAPDGLVGNFTIRVGKQRWGVASPVAPSPIRCKDVSVCEVTIAKSDTEPWNSVYEDVVENPQADVLFEVTNGLYVPKHFTFTNGSTTEVRWGEGEGGVDPGGKTYRSSKSTYSDVRAELSLDRSKVILNLICAEKLTLNTFASTCSDNATVSGTISADLRTIHIVHNGVPEDAFLVE